MNPLERALASFAASRPGSWFYLNVANPIDRRLLPLTGGRFSVSIGQPVLCLEVVGAKSGRTRRIPLLFQEVDGQIVIVASPEERDHLWAAMVNLYPGFEVYEGRARGIREIPIVVLERS